MNWYGLGEFELLLLSAPTPLNYLKAYNYSIPQRALRNQTPIQALKKWQQERPELFVNTVCDQAGLDMKNTSKDYDGHPEPGRSIQKKELNQIQYSILLGNAQGKVKFIEGNFQRVQDELN
jgi:hypothetical protein